MRTCTKIQYSCVDVEEFYEFYFKFDFDPCKFHQLVMAERLVSSLSKFYKL